ncbi:BgTH12-00542 [Blumeria graminis f. sp. triticale]|uniref:peptidyl-tRNA hydrolase n=3 Tax=Blumeria graminis TaxID=34373 RepID=A0A381LA11_BLUGR|nr:mitochondrially-localized peptidyl-tRNA hydrolase [Blumeria graminis f. sp. tritici 96224]CAD6505043.1 BgTH12-00542 [Blumeria graminis f. sp. triticale]VDB93048.1 Bgt-4108 [Blumeria graminis f. sp. tritici]
MTTEPPTPVAMLIGTAIIAGISGYMIGMAASLGLVPNPFSWLFGISDADSIADDASVESEAQDIDDSLLDHAPNWTNSTAADEKDGLRTPVTARLAPLSNDEECKLVLLVRTDLGMTKGKIAAQCSHATLACYKHHLRAKRTSPLLRQWERQGQAKIALQVKSEGELSLLQDKALSLGLVAEVITDAGRTQIASGSQTVLGIGPAPRSIIDQVTGHLKLL